MALKLHCHFRELSFFTRRGASVCGGDQNFFGWSEGGGQFFTGSKGGTRTFPLGQMGGGGPEFFYLCKGRPVSFTIVKGGDRKKMAIARHK